MDPTTDQSGEVGITAMKLQKIVPNPSDMHPYAEIAAHVTRIITLADYTLPIRDNLYLEIRDFIRCGYRMYWIFTNLPSMR